MSCPYCGSDAFVGSTTTLRAAGPDPDFPESDAEWNNECDGCGGWSVHRDVDHAQLGLEDPGDPTSEVVG